MVDQAEFLDRLYQIDIVADRRHGVNGTNVGLNDISDARTTLTASNTSPRVALLQMAEHGFTRDSAADTTKMHPLAPARQHPVL
jgi:hypothetical protein